MTYLHDWVKSTLGHGETMCRRCKITNREAGVLGRMNECDVPPPPDETENYLRTILHCCMKARGLTPLGTPTEDAAVDALKMIYAASKEGHP